MKLLEFITNRKIRWIVQIIAIILMISIMVGVFTIVNILQPEPEVGIFIFIAALVLLVTIFAVLAYIEWGGSSLRILPYIGYLFQLLGIMSLSFSIGLIIEEYQILGNLLWEYDDLVFMQIFNFFLGAILFSAGYLIQTKTQELLKPDTVFEELEGISEVNYYEVIVRIIGKINSFNKFVYVIVILFLYPAMSSVNRFNNNLRSEVEIFNGIYGFLLILLVVVVIYLNYEMRTTLLKLKNAARPLENLVKDLS
ncbi:MAG: hypothetical protein IH840_16790 [Candidatus Heimdallarchaeota archaeon]|nr:hypothetical protein [Candidatus Heimdallarchaeota archaeon]